MTIGDCSPIRQSCSQPREWTPGLPVQSRELAEFGHRSVLLVLG
jgi:hypothetical protein